MSLFDRFRSLTQSPADADKPDKAQKDCPDKEDQKQYRSAQVSAFSLGDGNELARRRGSLNAHVISQMSADLIRRCTCFESLENHADNICRSEGLPQSHQDELRKELTQLVDLGFFCSEEDVRRHLVAANETEPDIETISHIALLSCDRLACCRQTLQTYIDNARGFGRTPLFSVFDDSSDPAVRNNYRDMLRQLARHCGVPITYFGYEEKRQLVESLLEDLTGEHQASECRELLEFAVFGQSDVSMVYGGNRNSVLLCTPGNLILTPDDDVRCQVASIGDDGDKLKYYSGFDPTEIWFYRERQEAVEAADFVQIDLLTLHEKLLGRRPVEGRFTEEIRYSADIDQANISFLETVGNGLGRVLVTSTGLLGDSGMGLAGPMYYLTRHGDSRRRLTADLSKFQELQYTREILRGVTNFTISEGSFLMSTALGMDNRAVLPPFFPLGRNIDAVFSLVLRSCLNHAYIGHIPYALLHEPPTDRRNTPDALKRVVSSNHLSDLLLACIQLFARGEVGSGSPFRLSRLGAFLCDLTSQSTKDFNEILSTLCLQNAFVAIARCDDLLTQYRGLPTVWANALEQQINAIRLSTQDPNFTVPADLVNAFGTNGAREKAKELIKQYGRLLRIWEPVMESAGRIAQRRTNSQ